MALRSSGGDAVRMSGDLTRVALPAPADRPSGDRGPRAPLAWIAGVGAVVALALSHGGGAASYSSGRATIDYRMDGPSWTGPAVAAVVVALALAGVLLWAARHRALVAIGLALLPLAVVGDVVTQIERHRAGRVSRRAALAVPLGSSRSEVEDRLGWPAGHGHLAVGRERFDCLIYVPTDARSRAWERRLALCFRAGRLARRRTL
jgi:hypothetical protein